jgi:hypothetical protein
LNLYETRRKEVCISVMKYRSFSPRSTFPGMYQREKYRVCHGFSAAHWGILERWVTFLALISEIELSELEQGCVKSSLQKCNL